MQAKCASIQAKFSVASSTQRLNFIAEDGGNAAIYICGSSVKLSLDVSPHRVSSLTQLENPRKVTYKLKEVAAVSMDGEEVKIRLVHTINVSLGRYLTHR